MAPSEPQQVLSSDPELGSPSPPTRNGRGYVSFVVILSVVAWVFVSLDISMLGVAIPTLSSSLGLSLSTLEILSGVFWFVSFATPVVLGRWLDRLGRRRGFQLALLGTGLFGGITAVVGAAWQFIVVRVLTATSFGLTEPAVTTMIAEEAPRRHRGFLMGLVQAGAPLGAGITGMVAAAILPTYGWRPLFLLAFAPVLLVLVSSFFLRESRQFRALQQAGADRPRQHRPGWRALFVPGQRRQTVVTTLFGFCMNGGIGLAIGVASAYLVHIDHIGIGAAAFLFGLSNWVALGSQILVGWLTDHIPAKWLMAVYAVLGACALSLLALPTVTYATATISLLGFGFFGNGTFGCYTRYTTESYPTELRGTGTSFSFGFSFLSTSFMPIIGGILIESSHPMVIPLIGAGLVLCGAIAVSCGRNFPPGRELDELSPSAVPTAQPASGS